MEYGSQKPEGYIRRIADDKLAKMLNELPAVEVYGTMWCGKTWTSMAFAESAARIGQRAGRLAAEADPETALLGDTPHVIDEWQDVPPIWDEVRAAIDREGYRPGQFILTGSAEPRKDEVSHSGAGRIGRLKMHTMTLAETGDSSGKVSLKGLFDGVFEPTAVHQRLLPLAEMICRGGWPGLIGGTHSASSSETLLDSYFDALFDINIPRRHLSGQESRRVAESLARNLCQAVTMPTIAKDAGFTDTESRSAAVRASAHVSALEELYVIDPVSGWDAPIRSKSRLRIKPKYYFADPSLAASLLQITPERLATDGQLFGLLFEALCIHDLQVYASVLPHAKNDPVQYYRDSDGLETDAIIELRDGRWAGFEIKLGENKWMEAADSLERLRKKIAANPAARNPRPEFMAVLVGAGEAARYDREHDVYVIPITTLGP